jgi:endonuclease YncB( thermonuclease family)
MAATARTLRRLLEAILIVLPLVWAPFAWAASATTVAVNCSPDRIDRMERVSYVLDGDTFVLHGGQHVRVIGLDTPEIGRQGRPSQPYANAARDLLRRWLEPGTPVSLRYDVVRNDKYGRRLAHVYRDSTNLAAALLREGLATHLVIPPNAWAASCYADAEATARRAGLGLWSRPEFRATKAAALPKRSARYAIVDGRVAGVETARNALWVDLDGRLSLRVAKKDLIYFDGLDVDRWLGRDIQVRGRIRALKGGLLMTVRHPSSITLKP